MKRGFGLAPVFGLFLFSSIASAQFSVDAYIGAGSYWNKSNNQGIDNLNSPTNALGPCTLNSGDTYCQATSSLNSVFMGIGGDIMFKKQFGFGANVDFMPARKDYGPLQFRQTFYDFNGIYQPFSSKRAALRFEGGIGAAHTGFAITQSGCVGTAVCSSSTSPIGTANHFDVHIGAGLMLYVTNHVFVKPQVDLHYVSGFTDQFNSNLTPGFMVSVGYSSGDH